MVHRNTHVVFASSYIMNHAGMRKGQEQQALPAVQLAQREGQVPGGWCLPSSGQQFDLLTGPGTHKEVLLPNMKTKCHVLTKVSLAATSSPSYPSKNLL